MLLELFLRLIFCYYTPYDHPYLCFYYRYLTINDFDLRPGSLKYYDPISMNLYKY